MKTFRTLTVATAAAMAILTGTAAAHEPIRNPAEACHMLRRVGIIPEGAPARVIGFPDLGNHKPFLCLLPGQTAKGLRVRFTLAPQHEDEPTRIEVLGTKREPIGPMTDAECEAVYGAGWFAKDGEPATVATASR